MSSFSDLLKDDLKWQSVITLFNLNDRYIFRKPCQREDWLLSNSCMAQNDWKAGELNGLTMWLPNLNLHIAAIWFFSLYVYVLYIFRIFSMDLLTFLNIHELLTNCFDFFYLMSLIWIEPFLYCHHTFIAIGFITFIIIFCLHQIL